MSKLKKDKLNSMVCDEENFEDQEVDDQIRLDGGDSYLNLPSNILRTKNEPVIKDYDSPNEIANNLDHECSVDFI